MAEQENLDGVGLNEKWGGTKVLEREAFLALIEDLSEPRESHSVFRKWKKHGKTAEGKLKKPLINNVI